MVVLLGGTSMLMPDLAEAAPRSKVKPNKTRLKTKSVDKPRQKKTPIRDTRLASLMPSEEPVLLDVLIVRRREIR